MVNVHFSLLPRWRGAAPVERAILAGDTETGVCLMQLEEGLDTGPVYARATTPIGPEETADELRDRLGTIGTQLLVRSLAAGLGDPEPQRGDPTYAAKVEPAELQLDFSFPAEVVNRSVRIGRAWTTFREKRLLVHKARVLADGPALFPGQIQGNTVGTAHGSLELLVVQPEGKPLMNGGAWARGARPGPTNGWASERPDGRPQDDGTRRRHLGPSRSRERGTGERGRAALAHRFGARRKG